MVGGVGVGVGGRCGRMSAVGGCRLVCFFFREYAKGLLNFYRGIKIQLERSRGLSCAVFFDGKQRALFPFILRETRINAGELLQKLQRETKK